MRPMVVAILAVLGAMSCRTRSNASIDESFHRDPRTFERLRALISDETQCDEVWADHLEWVDPCNRGACDGAPPRTPRVPVMSPAPCDAPLGCRRWRDGAPTADMIARLCGIRIERAREYLEAMERIGALRLIHSRIAGGDDVVFNMRFTGIVPSGSTTSIVWRRTEPNPLRMGAPGGHGYEYVRLRDDGWWRMTEWN